MKTPRNPEITKSRNHEITKSRNYEITNWTILVVFVFSCFRVFVANLGAAIQVLA